MEIDVLECPSCGHAVPESAKPDQLVTCPACNMTLFIRDWEVSPDRDVVRVSTPNRVYTVKNLLVKDDLCNIYQCDYTLNKKERKGLFRIAQDAGDNDLVQNEARTLYFLQATSNYEDFYPFLPTVLESFLYQDTSNSKARQVNILGLHEDIVSPNELYSLDEVRHHYSSGIDARDMAWMWRRLLKILGYSHHNAVIHGGVLPNHILIEPEEHKLILVGWDYSVREPKSSGKCLEALSIAYEAWYPREVPDRQAPMPGLDIFLGARCMLYLLGGDPIDEPFPRGLELPLQRHFEHCLEAQPQDRPQDAWDLLDEFDQIIEQLWGPRAFREFRMPYKS